MWLCSSIALPHTRPPLPSSPWPCSANRIKDGRPQATPRTATGQPNSYLTGKPLYMYTVHSHRQASTTRPAGQNPQLPQHNPRTQKQCRDSTTNSCSISTTNSISNSCPTLTVLPAEISTKALQRAMGTTGEPSMQGMWWNNPPTREINGT